MKGLKKVALASAIAAVSAGAQAELKALDDSTMGELTGQAGLTIDIETKWSIGEFMYKDAGSVLISGISLGGNQNTTDGYVGNESSYLDNIRLTLDIAGSNAAENASLNYGFSEIGRLTAFLDGAGNTDSAITANATAVLGGGNATDYTTGLIADVGVGQWAAGLGSEAQGTENGGDAAGVEDGDLVIHWGFTDAFLAGGGFAAYAAGAGIGGSLSTVDWDDARDIATRAVDFTFNIDSISLADSSYQAGQAIEGTVASTTQTTTLISGLNLKGYLGPADLHIENDGNGFGADGSTNPIAAAAGQAESGNADSKITWGSYFRVTDLDLYIDIAGLQLTDVEIKNTRGDQTGLDGTSSFGFAHSRRTIYAVKDAVIDLAHSTANPVGNYVDGLALNTEFKGDIDIGALSFGDTGESIGSIYLTDIESDTRWTISAH